MASDDNRMTDGVRADLNPTPDDAPTEGEAAGLRRPADSAAKPAWVDYVVGLGASRAYAEGDSWHYRPDLDTGAAAPEGQPHPAYEQAAPLTKGDLIEFADRLGG